MVESQLVGAASMVRVGVLLRVTLLADRLLQSLVGTKNHCEEGACSNPDARKRNFCLEKLCQLQVVVLSKYWENLSSHKMSMCFVAVLLSTCTCWEW